MPIPREYVEIEAYKTTSYMRKKDAAKLLMLARKTLEEVAKTNDSREIKLALINCEQASMWLDSSEFGHLLECEW